MSNQVLPLPIGLTWDIKKRANWSNIIQRSASGREVRSPLYTNPIWEWELTWSYLPDYTNFALLNYDAPSSPVLSTYVPVPSGAFPATTYYVIITYVYPTGETLASAEAAYTVPAGDFLQVDSPSDPGDGAIGWNCYVGVWSGGELLQLLSVPALDGSQVLQPGPIPLGTTWIESSDGLSAHPSDPQHVYSGVGTAQCITPPPIEPPGGASGTDSEYSVWQQLLGFYNARQGSYDSFLFADATDSFLFNFIGTGDGSTTTFQLTRNFGGFSEVIQNPFGPIAIAVAGTTLTSGFSVSSTGLVTFASAPANGAAIYASGSFFYRVRFSDDNLEGNNFLYNLFELKKLGLTSVKL